MKTTMRYYCIPIRITTIGTVTTLNAEEDAENLHYCYLAVGKGNRYSPERICLMVS
jgi:hypothetical protein